MVKSIYVFLLMILLLGISFVGASITGEIITGDSITGNVTSHEVSFGIYVVSIPSLSINLPFSGVYFNNLHLPLNYTVSNANFVWYNLDGGMNFSISNFSSEVYFNVTEGSHILYIYANNSYGESFESISFNVNLSKFLIEYSELFDSSKGVSTNFNSSSYEEIQDLPGVFFENYDYGKISFLDSINVTNDTYFDDHFVDIDNNVNISFNKIEINSLVLPNFNKPAQLKLYNLTFNNPRILKKGALCSDCSVISYSSGVLIFNVNGFSVYSAEETPSTESALGGGGGSSSSKIVTYEDISFNTDLLKFKISQNSAENYNFLIFNNGLSKINFQIEIDSSINPFVKINVDNISLEAGEKEIIPISIFATENNIPDVYFGNLMFNSDKFTKILPVIIEIISKDSLFDVKLHIPLQFKNLKPGQDLVFNVRVSNLGDYKVKQDVILEFFIKDFKGNILIQSENSLAVETSISHQEIISIPEDFKTGKYVIYVRILYEDKIASASETFYVEKSSLRSILRENLIFILFVIIIFFALLVTHLILRHKRLKMHVFLSALGNKKKKR